MFNSLNLLGPPTNTPFLFPRENHKNLSLRNVSEPRINGLDKLFSALGTPRNMQGLCCADLWFRCADQKIQFYKATHQNDHLKHELSKGKRSLEKFLPVLVSSQNVQLHRLYVLKLYVGPFSKVESVQTCRRAILVGTAECALNAYAGPFSKEESLDLCGGKTIVANGECTIKEYSGYYSIGEAIKICKSSCLKLPHFDHLQMSKSILKK